MRYRGMLNDKDRASYRAAISFLENRLEERETVEWALRLKANDREKRSALSQLIDQSQKEELREPWKTAWRLIEESWSDPAPDDLDRLVIYDIQRRLKSGERSAYLADRIANFVKPRIELEPFSRLHLSYHKPPKRPKSIEELFSASLGEADLVDLTDLKLEDITEKDFLWSLSLYLESVIHGALDAAKRIGWDGEYRYWKIGRLNRVYYVQPKRHDQGDTEPDAFNHGIAPSVKLLHSVVVRLSEIDLNLAADFARRLMVVDTPVHVRLWTALSFNPHITPIGEVEKFLIALNDRRFWDVDWYPEVAELRSRRFNELGPKVAKKIISRIKKGPSRSYWPKDAEEERIKNVQLYWSIRELKRIEIAGGKLPSDIRNWMEENVQNFEGLLEMDRIDEGFPESVKVRAVVAESDDKYDFLEGENRLKALEKALATERTWDVNSSGFASAWIRKQGNATKIISDLESAAASGADYLKVWDRFGWTHSPVEKKANGHDDELLKEGKRVLELIVQLPDPTIRDAINGVSHWLSAWAKPVAKSSACHKAWFKVWPLAVEATNEAPQEEEGLQLNTLENRTGDQKPRDLDTLNSPAGKLIGVFLAACPNLGEIKRPFHSGSPLRKMRDAIFDAAGTSLLIAKYRLIESLPYFLTADSSWTKKNLIAPLAETSEESLRLWRAIARRTHFKDVLEIIGHSMVERSVDRRLDRETRHSLVFSIVIECLHAFFEGRSPVVPEARIQQMIRSLEEELRAYGAEAVYRFVRDMSKKRDDVRAFAPGAVFQAARKFLQEVWPQERSLASPGVSKAFAEIPSVSGEAFAEAVTAIERFLVPFDCWSIMDYGLYGAKGDEPRLSTINDREKAEAFLRLLDLTIGTSEGAVVPHELGQALEQIGKVEPRLVEDRTFRRLATAARR